jgi:hypothetical protein
VRFWGETLGGDSGLMQEKVIFAKFFNHLNQIIGGEGGIRTHGTLARTTVFETAPIDHSGTSPRNAFPYFLA